MAHLLALMNRFGEAEKYLHQGLERMSVDYGDNELEGAYIFWMTNNKVEGRKRFMNRIEFCEMTIKERSPFADKRAAYELASIYSFLGNEKLAYYWLQQYAAMGFREGLENYILIDPLFGPIRNQPEFKRIVESARANKEQLRTTFQQLEKDKPLIKQ